MLSISVMRTLIQIAAIMLPLLFAGCNSLFFYPRKQFYDNPSLKLFIPEDIYFNTTDGLTLHGWFLKADNARASILVLHGNAENLSTHVNSVLWLVPEGFNLFIFDYRGYGRSGGKPSIEGVHLDAEAALEALFSVPGVDRGRIIILGQSLGGAVAVTMTAGSPHKDKIRALVVESAFSSYREIAREKMGEIWFTWPFQYPLSLFFNDDYSPIKNIKNVFPVHILIMHGGEDIIVPVRHGKRLYDAAREPREFWQTDPAGHVRSFADQGVRRRFIGWLDQLLSR